MVYRHMIYSPETESKYDNKITVHTFWTIANIYAQGDEHLQVYYISVHDGSFLSSLTLLPVLFVAS